MRKNSSGKVLTVFLVIIAILLISLTAIFAFFFQKEIERRKVAENLAETSIGKEQKLEQELKEAKKQIYLLEEKNKEADERINSLLDEIELDEGIRNELKTEVASLKEKLDKASKEKDKVRKEMTQQVLDADQRVAELEAKLKVETNRVTDLKDLNKELESKVSDLNKLMKEMKEKAAAAPAMPAASAAGLGASSAPAPDQMAGGDAAQAAAPAQNKAATPDSYGVVLEPIVVVPGERLEDVNPEDLEEPPVEEVASTSDNKKIDDVVVVPKEIPDGRILSVDVETEFVIINLGEKDGVDNGRIMSVYRGSEFLGDIKVTRVQPEMSAADLIPPFSARMVRKNDQVTTK